MLRNKIIIAIVFPLAGAGCIEVDGSDAREDVSIAVEDASEPLTTKSRDKLFKLTLTKASKPYELSAISVDVGLPGDDRMAVNFEHEDANGDGKLDQGESLICAEPPVNIFDPSSEGKTATVAFAERRDGILVQVGTTTWKL